MPAHGRLPGQLSHNPAKACAVSMPRLLIFQASYIALRLCRKPTLQSSRKEVESWILAATHRDVLYDTSVNDHRDPTSVSLQEQTYSFFWPYGLQGYRRPETFGFEEHLKRDRLIVSECPGDVWVATLPQPDLQFWINNHNLNTFRRPSVTQQVVQNLSSHDSGWEPSPKMLVEHNDCVLVRG